MASCKQLGRAVACRSQSQGQATRPQPPAPRGRGSGPHTPTAQLPTQNSTSSPPPIAAQAARRGATAQDGREKQVEKGRENEPSKEIPKCCNSRAQTVPSFHMDTKTLKRNSSSQLREAGTREMRISKEVPGRFMSTFTVQGHLRDWAREMLQ